MFQGSFTSNTTGNEKIIKLSLQKKISKKQQIIMVEYWSVCEVQNGNYENLYQISNAPKYKRRGNK